MSTNFFQFYYRSPDWWKDLDSKLLSKNELQKVQMEKEDSPAEYEPMKPVNFDGRIEGLKIRNIKEERGQRNGFDQGWKVESIIGIGPDEMCYVKFIGIRTPQMLPITLVMKHAKNEFFQYRNWVSCKENPELRGDYWDEQLNEPSSWMTQKAFENFESWQSKAKAAITEKSEEEEEEKTEEEDPEQKKNEGEAEESDEQMEVDSDTSSESED